MEHQPQRLKQALENLRQALEETESALLELEGTFVQEENTCDLRSEAAKTFSLLLRSARR